MATPPLKNVLLRGGRKNINPLTATNAGGTGVGCLFRRTGRTGDPPARQVGENRLRNKRYSAVPLPKSESHKIQIEGHNVLVAGVKKCGPEGGGTAKAQTIVKGEANNNLLLSRANRRHWPGRGTRQWRRASTTLRYKEVGRCSESVVKHYRIYGRNLREAEAGGQVRHC